MQRSTLRSSATRKSASQHTMSQAMQFCSMYCRMKVRYTPFQLFQLEWVRHIIVAFGGRVAEELIFGDVTTGASQDIKQATATARAMVVKYGMSERLGTINYEDSGEEEVFLGRDLGHARSYSEDVAREIDIEVKRIIDEAYAQAKTIITEHMDVLHRCAQVLNAEFEAIFDGRELPKPGAEQTSLMSGMPSEGR